MQPNPKSTSRLTSVNPLRPTFYDPSEPYRALLKSPNNQKSENPTMSRDIPTTNIDLRTGAPKQIPQYFYPRYDDFDDPTINPPSFVQPQRLAPTLQQVPQPAQTVPVVIQQPVPNIIHPYSQPIAYPTDPYASGQYYPYGQPYLIPLTSSVPQSEPVQTFQDRSKSDVIAAHQQDADLSRLEVYHFTPKQDGPSKGTSLAQGSQPIIQYHVYPHPPAAAPPPPQQYPPYPQPWPAYPPNGPPYPPNGPTYPPNGPSYPPNGPTYPHNVPPYVAEPPPPPLHFSETKARGSQTEQPPTKNRAVSPMYTTAPAPYDDDGYPYIHHKNTRTDRHHIPTGRVDRRIYESHRSTPLSDCRCLDCQQERSKVLNYYPD